MLSTSRSREDLDHPCYGSISSTNNRTASRKSSVASIMTTSRSNSEADGIAEMEAVTKSWTKTGLYTAWATIIVLSIAISLAMQSIFIFSNYATASFTRFSLLSALQVVQGVLYVVTRPLVAKIADVIGRFEGFLMSTLFMTVGILMLAASPNINVYFVAQIFYIIGQVGLQFMQVIFAADTSSLANRALFTILPNACFAFVPWTTAPLTTAFLEHLSWRWGIAVWGLVLPCCAVPLLTILFIHKLKSKRHLAQARRPFSWKRLLVQLDLGGSGLLATGLTLIFVAIPLASGVGEWRQPHILFMLLCGGVCLITFPFYETLYAKFPILTVRQLKNPELGKAFLFITLYVVAYSIYSPYFFAWLRVVFDLSNTAATNLNAVTTVSSVVSGSLSALFIKWTRTIKSYVLLGVVVHTVGLGLIYHYRKVGSTTAQLVVAEMIDGLGAGLLTTPNQVFVQAFCAHKEVAQITGLYLAFFSLGQVIGDAISGAIYRRYFAFELARIFPDKPKEWISQIFDDYTKALEYSVGSEERIGINDAFNFVMRRLLLPPILIYVAMFFIALMFKNIKLDEMEEDVAGVVFGSSTTASSSSPDTSRTAKRDSASLHRRSINDFNDILPAAGGAEQFYYERVNNSPGFEDDPDSEEDVDYEMT